MRCLEYLAVADSVYLILQALLRDQETETAIEEAEIRNMELQLKKKMFEQVHKIFSL